MSRDVKAMWSQVASEARLAAEQSKLPMEPFERLSDLYSSLDDVERQVATHILSDEVLSFDEGVRYDALAIIKEFAIAETVPALRQLLQRVEAATDVGARFEADKVRRMISALSGRQSLGSDGVVVIDEYPDRDIDYGNRSKGR